MTGQMTRVLWNIAGLVQRYRLMTVVLQVILVAMTLRLWRATGSRVSSLWSRFKALVNPDSWTTVSADLSGLSVMMESAAMARVRAGASKG